MSKKEEEKEEGKEGHDAAPAKKKSKLPLIIGAVVLLIAAAGVPLFLLGGGAKADKTKEAAQEEKTPEKQLVTVPLDIFIVNLSESGAFLKVKMLLECDNTILKKAEEEAKKKGAAAPAAEGKEGAGGLTGYLKEREPMIRDSIIRILSAKRSTEMLSLDGKEKLKEDLIEGVNEAIGLEDSAVQSIYFTEFIIQ